MTWESSILPSLSCPSETRRRIHTEVQAVRVFATIFWYSRCSPQDMDTSTCCTFKLSSTLKLSSVNCLSLTSCHLETFCAMLFKHLRACARSLLLQLRNTPTIASARTCLPSTSCIVWKTQNPTVHIKDLIISTWLCWTKHSIAPLTAS